MEPKIGAVVTYYDPSGTKRNALVSAVQGPGVLKVFWVDDQGAAHEAEGVAHATPQVNVWTEFVC